MFDVGFPELFIVAVLAIIVVGPKDLPKVIRSVMGMIKKVREMGSEFQAGVKKMADEVELDAVTRKLNEAGNVKIDDKSAADPATEPSEYAEFDYDEYDYEGHNYAPAAEISKDKSEDDVEGEEESPSEDEPVSEVEAVASEEDILAPDIIADEDASEDSEVDAEVDAEVDKKSKSDE